MTPFRIVPFPAWLVGVVVCVLVWGTLQAQGVFNANNNYTPVGAGSRAFITDHAGQPAPGVKNPGAIKGAPHSD
jgi:hypothetical protein